MSADCPCGGQHWASWHKLRGLPMCAEAKAKKSGSDVYSDRRRRARGARGSHGERPAVWIPGTVIDVPEHDPL